MSTISPPTDTVPEKRGWTVQLRIPEMWASIAISMMWLAVLADAIWGPSIITNNDVAGAGSNATVPSAVVLGLFAFLGTWVVAYFGFGRSRDED